MKFGDKVYVTDENRNFKNELMIVLRTNDPDYLPYVGEHVAAIDSKRVTHSLSKGQYITEEQYLLEQEKAFKDLNESLFGKKYAFDNVSDTPKTNKIPSGSCIKVNKKTERLQKAVYPVMESETNRVRIVDDFGNSKWLSNDQVEAVGNSNLLSIIIDLSEQLSNLRSVNLELVNVVKADLDVIYNNLKS